MRRVPFILLLLLSSPAFAGPNIPPGDLALRHDIHRLADAGVITGPVTTWPLAWGPILADIATADPAELPPAVTDALARVERRADWETRSNELTFDAEAGLADNATRIRSFQDTPRGRGEASLGLNWIGDRLSLDLNAQYVDSAQDDQDGRLDDSFFGIALGNWSVAASTQQRWWGPGWDGSLILSNNARPIPSLVIDRVFTDAFETKWLSWLGPWDLTVMFGQLESERFVPNARFFGMRLNFRPIPSLEFGVTRTAQWCGDGRPCGFETFVDLLLGRDNIGDEGIDMENEPGNQLAGLDFRWSFPVRQSRLGLYGQFIGEDEAGGFPSRYLGQVGVEISGSLLRGKNYTAFVETVLTNCEFTQTEDHSNCAYNHDIYRTGYRYRGRPIGHGADNDAKFVSAGMILVTGEGLSWQAIARKGELNRLGSPDPRNSLTATQLDIVSGDIIHTRGFSFGTIEVSIGYEYLEDVVMSTSKGELRSYVTWRSGF